MEKWKHKRIDCVCVYVCDDTHLIKVSYDLIEQSEAFLPPFIYLGLIIELPEARNGGKHHTDIIVLLGIQLQWEIVGVVNG